MKENEKSIDSAKSTQKLFRYINMFLDHINIERGYSDNTIESYRHDLKCYIEFIVSKEITEFGIVTSKHLKEFLILLHEIGLGVASRYRYLSAIRTFHKYLLSERITKKDITENITQAREKATRNSFN
jgi:integrase/recombinase XerD